MLLKAHPQCPSVGASHWKYTQVNVCSIRFQCNVNRVLHVNFAQFVFVCVCVWEGGGHFFLNRGLLKSVSAPACTSRVLFMADEAHKRRFLSSYNIPPFFAFLPMFGDEWERRGRNITIWHILLIE